MIVSPAAKAVSPNFALVTAATSSVNVFLTPPDVMLSPAFNTKSPAAAVSA